MPVLERKELLKIRRFAKWIEQKGWTIKFRSNGSFKLKKLFEEIEFRK
jgi:hypothetical protein